MSVNLLLLGQWIIFSVSALVLCFPLHIGLTLITKTVTVKSAYRYIKNPGRTFTCYRKFKQLDRMITKSKILCTLGPSSNKREQILKMAQCGMDVARINFSHGTPESKKELFQLIRKTDPSLSILCDIQGPKIRIGKIKKPEVFIKRGLEIVITTDEIEGDEQRFSISYKELPHEVKKGDHLYINDGTICLLVKEIKGKEIFCRSLIGGFLSSKKGVNLPFTKISLRVPTEKDVEDLKIIAKLDPEYVALSFVGTANDVVMIRKILSDEGNDRIKLIAKIERPVAVQNFDEILEVADGIMVARG